MANTNASLFDITAIPSFCREKSFRLLYHEIDDAVRREDEPFLRDHLLNVAKKKENAIQQSQKLEGLSAVNLSGDPLLCVLIAYEKTSLACRLLNHIDPESLLDVNLQGNNALHVAAAVGDKVMDVAEELILRNRKLLDSRNKDQETPLLKAALHGQRRIFWKLYNLGGEAIVDAKKNDGSNALHCAIMGNAPRLALEVAQSFPYLKTRRNSAAVTPLQLVVTIPGIFKSKMQMSPFDVFIYQWIPHGDGSKANPAASLPIEVHDNLHTAQEQQDEENPQHQRRRTLPPNYATMLSLLEVIKIPAKWANLLIFRILKQMFKKIESLEELKIHHRETLELIECLAGDVEYWDFIDKGKTGQLGETRSLNTGKSPRLYIRRRLRDLEQLDMDLFDIDDENDFNPPTHNDSSGDNPQLPIGAAKDAGLERWTDSPLITGAKMGLHEFVEKILEVYPQSVNILDVEGKNILQVAIQMGQGKILDMVAPRIAGKNPLLPSRLLYSRDKENNTFLHYAAEMTVKAEGANPLQMQRELQWFEKVEKLLPKDLQYSRNADEKTAQELFSEKHQVMAMKGKEELSELGKTCSGLVAAFVFASSFSIPGSGGGSGSEGGILKEAAFKVFKHAFVFGLSCASTALVLFLSLATSSYKEREFRRSVPTKYFFAGLSFMLALVSLLVAFACNIFLQTYSGKRIGAKDLIPFVGELAIFPVITWLVLLYRGSPYSVMSLVRQIWR